MNLLLQQTTGQQQQTPSSSTYGHSSGHSTITTASQQSTVQSGGTLPPGVPSSIRPGSAASTGGPPPQPPPRSTRPLNSVGPPPGAMVGGASPYSIDGMHHPVSSGGLGHHPGSVSPPLSGRSTPKAHPVHVPNVIPPSQRPDSSGVGAPYMHKYHTVSMNLNGLYQMVHLHC